MKRIAYILLFCLLCLTKSMAAIHVPADTLTMDEKVERYNDSIQKVQSRYAEQIKARGTVLDSIAKISAPFDARDYIMQKRFVKKGQLDLYPQHWYQRLSFGAFTGAQTIVQRGNTDVDWTLPAGLYARYEFNRLHSLRLSYQFADYNVERRECDMALHTAQLDYMFSLSNYFAGYNPDRFFNAAIAVGGGYIHNTYLAESKNAYQGQLGLNMSFRLSRLSNLFIEPFVAFASDDIDRSEESNGHRYDIVYGVKAGISIDTYKRLGGYKVSRLEGYEVKEEERGRLNSLEVTTGIAMLPSNESIYLDQALTSSTSIAYTRWFDVFVGLRIGGTMNIANAAKQSLAQADIMLNMLNLFPRYRNATAPVFEWDLALGGRAGWQWRDTNEHSSQNMSTGIYGFSIASPLVFNVSPSWAITLEPGVQWMNYNVPYTNYDNYRLHISDPSYSVRVGARWNLP